MTYPLFSSFWSSLDEIQREFLATTAALVFIRTHCLGNLHGHIRDIRRASAHNSIDWIPSAVSDGIEEWLRTHSQGPSSTATLNAIIDDLMTNTR
jgi:hypothetical protein